jgi:hypothetical protein
MLVEASHGVDRGEWQEAPRPRPPVVPGYEVGELVGAGAHGTVWSALPEGQRAAVALKVVAAEGEEAVAREVATLRGVRHPHLVPVHDVVALDDGAVAIVLDLLTGGSLADVVRARGHLSPGEVVTVLSPVASALSALHAAGVVHGDLSAGNVLLDRAGRPHVADLGTARMRGEVAGDVHGTRGFVAPEVVLGALPTAASDVYAVGALGWLCLTGEEPGPAPVRGRLRDASGVVAPGSPLVEVLDDALRGDPQARPTAEALAVALYDAAAPEPLRLVTAEDDVSALTQRIRDLARSDPGPARHRARRRGRRVARPRRRSAPPSSRAAGPGRPAREWWHRRGSPVPRTAVAAALALVVVAALAVAAVVAVRERPASATPDATGGRAAPGAAAVPGGPAAPRAGVGAPAEDARLSRDAPSRDPAGLVRALADARARAWTTGVAARLTEVDAPGSAALRADTESLAVVQRSGARYAGLRFTVRDASAVRATSDRSTVRAAVDASAYAVESAGGRTERPAERGSPVLLDLVWTDAGWRVAEVRGG